MLDLFGGSGSTLIAAHKTGRRGRICELDPTYCDRILRRWEGFAKDDAERVACGWAARAIVGEAAGDGPGDRRSANPHEFLQTPEATPSQPGTGPRGPQTAQARGPARPSPRGRLRSAEG